MKITLLLFLMLVARVYAQDKKLDAVTKSNAKARIEELLLNAELNSNNPDRLNDAIHKFIKDPARAYMTSPDRREISKRFIKVFNSIDDSLINMANKEWIIEIIGFSDNSPEAHEFFLKVLDSDKDKYREMALWGIRPHGVHGNDLYEKIKKLELNNKLSKVDSFGYLKNANPTRAAEEMKNFLRTTLNVQEFVIVGINIPKEAQEEAIDIIVDRYYELKDKPAQPGYSVDRAVIFKNLWTYIDARDGKRLQTALDIMRAQGVCGKDDLPRLEKKLNSLDQVTREAVVSFLADQTESGNLKAKDVLPLLTNAQSHESDKRVKQKIDNAILKYSNSRNK